jgi:phosphatidylinositol glycan class O
MILRIKWLGPSSSTLTTVGGVGSASIEIIAVVSLVCSWWDKRALEHSRTGFLTARIAMMAVFFGIFQSTRSLYGQWKLSIQYGLKDVGGGRNIENVQVLLFRLMLFLVIVTGPSAASSAVLILIQCATLRQLMDASGTRQLSAPTLAAIWRLAIRHAFFATNHHCSFNHLQFSAAFVATNIFQFHIAGMSLFMNTFGWEILGSCLILVYSRARRSNNHWGESSSLNRSNNDVWDWFLFFQWTEILASCVSVRMMKRHLMVWAIFAPRFMFAAIFSALAFGFGVVDVWTVERIASSDASTIAQNVQI